MSRLMLIVVIQRVLALITTPTLKSPLSWPTLRIATNFLRHNCKSRSWIWVYKIKELLYVSSTTQLFSALGRTAGYNHETSVNHVQLHQGYTLHLFQWD
eukprot:m.157479 g.157479  ORF g.157479 m.157479 type:complete len:99 (+) comp15119_c0_seq1:1388-1684(+)